MRSESAAPVPFPSVEWFRRLADLMNANRARQEQLGYVDCVAQFDVTGARPASVQVAFEEFGVVDVRATEDPARADFVLAAPLEVWRAMIESIAAGDGRPALEQTLNHLTHMDAPMTVRAADPLRRDLYFRYNQSLQEFVAACGGFRTAF